MPLSPYAIGSLPKLKTRASIKQSSVSLDADLEAVLDAATFVTEDELGQHVITRGAVTEFHNIREPMAHIWTGGFPIISITSLWEDPGRAYTGSGLTNGQEYLASSTRGRLTRVSGSIPLDWLMGERAVKLIYQFGYANAAAVPVALEHFVLNFATMIWREIEKGTINVTSYSDDLGNITRYAQACIKPEMKRPVMKYGRKGAPGGTPTVDRG